MYDHVVSFSYHAPVPVANKWLTIKIASQVLYNVLKAREPLQYQLAFITSVGMKFSHSTPQHSLMLLGTPRNVRRCTVKPRGKRIYEQ